MVAGYSWKFTAAMSAGLVWSLIWIVYDPPPVWAILVMVVLCYILTDLLSGMLHIILDNPRSLDVAFIKPLAEGFQSHHKDPANIYKMSLYKHLYVIHMPLTIFLPCALILHTPLGYVAWVTMVAMLHLMQMSHRWAHMPAKALHPILRGLQNVRLLLTRREHHEHHRPPYMRNFCIMTGVFNRPLNGVVRIFGARSHLWNLAFLGTCFVPVVISVLMPV